MIQKRSETFMLHEDVCLAEDALGWYEGRRCPKCGKPNPHGYHGYDSPVCHECRKPPQKPRLLRTRVCEGCGGVFALEPRTRRRYCEDCVAKRRKARK